MNLDDERGIPQRAPDGPLLARGRGSTPRVRRLARQLTELTRLEQALQRPTLTTVDLPALLHAICRDYTGVTLEAAASEQILTNARHLTAVMCAVLDNALIHGARPVTLNAHAGRVTVVDSGRGFAPELLPKATERFVTGSRSTSRGVGLGLALAAAHARLIGATLELANHPGLGAAVTIRISNHGT